YCSTAPHHNSTRCRSQKTTIYLKRYANTPTVKWVNSAFKDSNNVKTGFWKSTRIQAYRQNAADYHSYIALYGSVLEYLYAAKDEYAFDLERRTVFTWAYRVPLNEGKWRIEKVNDTILIFNLENFEYLFLDENKSDFFDGFAHLPFTLRSGEIPTQGAHWSLKQMASGKFVIRNIHYDTFLYAGHYHDAERRYALAHSFQWVKLYGFTDWNIRPCGP
ncbi:hypothetical protein B566_EDAN016256, partial [Ephemera danica]